MVKISIIISDTLAEIHVDCPYLHLGIKNYLECFVGSKYFWGSKYFSYSLDTLAEIDYQCLYFGVKNELYLFVIGKDYIALIVKLYDPLPKTINWNTD